MFSPDAPSHSHSLRPKRTRQAAGQDDSLKLPLAKRKRSALRRDTFEPLQEASLNEISGRNDNSPTTNARPTSSEKPAGPVSTQPLELTLRGGKKGDKRSERNSGVLTLSSNEFYTVSQLPALPDQIRSRPSVPYSCAISPEYGYALALTHSDALIWSYNSSATSPSSRDLQSFKLPFPPSSALDPLPLATFTARSAGGEPGVVAVSSKWGKIVYWETITNASSFIPGQTSSGVQGSIPGMLSGETVKEIINAEPAGFILSFSHGRVAHLTIRDQMGRPGIGVQFLRKAASTAVGGIFGSIRNAFGGDRRKGVPVVRAGRSSKGQRDVLVGTEDGEIEFWNTNLGVGNSMIKSLNIKDDIIDALKYSLPSGTATDWQFKLLDIELPASLSGSQDLTRQGVASTAVILLAALSSGQQTTYYIIETIITDTTCAVKVVHPIKCYTAPISQSPSGRPRLYLPKLSEMALVAFDTALVLFSLAKIEESPTSQLLLERQGLPDPFQDCIKFQEDTIYRILGLASEDQERPEKQSSCVFAVQGFGMVRVTTIVQQPSGDDEDAEFVARISAKNKIEQAVFFGTIRQNPLDLMSSTAGQSFTLEEISSATRAISEEILSSKSKYLPKTTPSIDMQMKLRAKALEDLAHYVLKHYSSDISRATRFQLLWDAEKLASAQAIWKVQEEIQRRYADIKDDREFTYMQFVLRALHETRQEYPQISKGETDSVRHWLTTSPGRMGYFVIELFDCLNELPRAYVHDPRVVVDWICEAEDLWIAAYDTAFKFREDNAQTYGLGDEVFKDGVLLGGYPEELPRVWTSDTEPIGAAEQFVYVPCKFLQEWWDYSPSKNKKKKMPADMDGNPYDAPSKNAMTDLAQRLPIIVELFCRLLNEECIHAQQQARLEESDPATLTELIAKIKEKPRPRFGTAIQYISRFNMPGAIKLTEKLGDSGLLVALNARHLQGLAAQQILVAATDSAEAARLEDEIVAVQDHCETYFDTIGWAWAFAHFSYLMRENEVNTMLMEVQADMGKKQKYLTWFMQKCEGKNFSIGKVSWINDVIGERRYDKAQETLENVAKVEEEDLWGKRTEICLAKLALLAATEDSYAKGVTPDMLKGTDSREYDNALTALDVQQKVYEHIKPTTLQTIDVIAAQEVVAEVFAKRVTENLPDLERILRRGLDGIVEKKAIGPADLVAVLTLMDPVEFGGADMDPDPEVLGHEFSLALKVIEVSNQLTRGEKEALQRVVWRRAMIRDDWAMLNETSLKDDAQVEREMRMTSLFRALRQVLETRDGQGPARLYSPLQILSSDVFPVGLQMGLEDAELEGVQRDLEVEQERLRVFVETRRLDEHFGGLVKAAEAALRGEQDRWGDEVAREALGRQDVDVDIDVDMDADLEVPTAQNNGFY